MTAQVFWIEAFGGRRLAILSRPRGGDWLADEVKSWRTQGVDVAVSLLTESEVIELGLAEELAASATAGMEFIAAPIADRSAPTSAEEFGELVSRLSDAIAGGKSIGMHCRAGIGRSAILAASLLVTTGMSPAEAFEKVRAARGAPVPDTSEQRAWVEQFARRFPVKAM